MREIDPLWRRVLPSLPATTKLETLPLVSVVVTTYNYEKFIVSCLSSVVAQTYSKLECVVVDDHSTDDTVELVERIREELGDRRLTVVRNSTNIGQLASQSTAMRYCRGSFVVFLDADDTLAPTFVERHLFAQLNSRYPSGLSVSDQITIDEDGVVHSGTRLNRDALAEVSTARAETISAGPQAPPLDVVFLPWKDVATHSPDNRYWQTQSAMMFRRSVLDLIVPSPDDCATFRICADSYLARFAHVIANSLILLEPLGSYRQHSSNNFAGPGFMSIDQQAGNMARHPTYDAFVELARTTIRHRQGDFDARIGGFHLSRIQLALDNGGMPGESKSRQGWLPRFFRP